MALYEFKDTSFTRGHRIQNIEENFSTGMKFTDAPLPEGYAKIMCNYDIKDSGELLKPRPGLQVTDLYRPATDAFSAPQYGSVGTSYHEGDVVKYKGSIYAANTEIIPESTQDFIPYVPQPSTNTFVWRGPTGLEGAVDWVRVNGKIIDPQYYSVFQDTDRIIIEIPKRFFTLSSNLLFVSILIFDPTKWDDITATVMNLIPTSPYAVNISAIKKQTTSNKLQAMVQLPIAAGNDNIYTMCVTGSETEDSIDITNPEHPVAHHTYVAELYNGLKYNHPEKAEIHNMPLENLLNITAPVGTWAWNDDYYGIDNIANQIVYTKYDAEQQRYKYNSVAPKVVTPAEATQYGYNMLSTEPYTFSNTWIADGNPFSITGILPYDSDNNLCMTPVANQQLTFRAYWRAPEGKQWNEVWEWREATSSAWNKIKDNTLTIDDVTAYLTCEFTPPTKNIIIRLTVTPTEDNPNNNPDAVLAVGFGFDKEAYGASANVKPDTYNLFSATGATYWKQRMVLWGIDEDKTMLFVSDVNDPSYFPYPNNADNFDEPIKYCVPFKEQLLVFTATKIWLLTMQEDGLSWTKAVLQSNLYISDWDIHLVQVVKNMVFFKSGNYFYMIVPKASTTLTNTTTDLGVAAISKPLYDFFDHFKDNIYDIINNMYDTKYSEDDPIKLVAYNDYLDFEDIHVVYTFKCPGKAELINIELLYNTVNRSWRMYTLGSVALLSLYTADATQRGRMCSLTTWPVKRGPGFDYGSSLCIQTLKWNPVEAKDYYIPLANITDHISWISTFYLTHFFKNYQYLDTGYREHQSNFKKRYRELQFTLNNLPKKTLQFYTDFFIDGEQRKNSHKYDAVLNNETHTLTIEESLQAPETTRGVTQLSTWTLDADSLPDIPYCKVRFPVSGKGYVPRIILQSRNEDLYELLNISWVYRPLYSR